MKNLKTIFLACSLATAASLGLTACSATPTQESTGQYVDSSAITAKVKAALLNAPNLNSTNISVETYKGTVQLSGFVNSNQQSTLAEQAAANVQGVTHVENDLIVRPTVN